MVNCLLREKPKIVQSFNIKTKYVYIHDLRFYRWLHSSHCVTLGMDFIFSLSFKKVIIVIIIIIIGKCSNDNNFYTITRIKEKTLIFRLLALDIDQMVLPLLSLEHFSIVIIKFLLQLFGKEVHKFCFLNGLHFFDSVITILIHILFTLYENKFTWTQENIINFLPFLKPKKK